MKWLRISTAVTGLLACTYVLVQIAPHARYSAAILAAQDDPAALSELRLDAVLAANPSLVPDNIEAALAAGDADLASSFVELARERNIALPDGLLTRVNDAVRDENSTTHFAKRFATGLVTGNADDVASLSGTVAGDLFVFGDVRDVVREGKHLAMGEETDHLILGLATAGLAVTAATYISVGGATPVRAGLSLVKDARKVGRLGEGLAVWAGRSAREVVDTPALKKAVASSSMFRPGESVSAIKAAFRAEKAGALVRLGKDVTRVAGKTGTRGALDTLRIAEGPKDVARAARLAEAQGGKTRAIMKLLGRGALLLVTGAFNFTMWLLGAAFTLLGLLSSIKATTERLTQSWCDRRRRRRQRQAQAEAAETALAGAAVTA
ncbi:hypothetical protein JQ596_15295 [Bradyrhizobium manausense]|uniref:hypothetical protein n=1 Tax=Bradyrhizobium TaxID=374 RepID=UPI001BA6141A|nr:MULTISPECIES: hypothetical protein [Bradyrhizobium]MBR0826913.1 hypothetical protein [Bradyrhizobium manausense]UVO32195.1 hypothetical protein KUF59_16955 [Bradyrhizobium arachidis]